MNSSVLPAPRWITFDCYGTLIDWETGVRRAFRELARVAAGEEEELFSVWERIQWDKIQEPYAPYAGILQSSFREALAQFGYECDGYTSESFVSSLGRWEPFPDVNPALPGLSKRCKLAIISNIDRELLGRSLRHFTVRFDALITAEDSRLYKPNPEVFRYALKKLGCLPEEVVHVAFGADYDFQPAASIGLRAVYLNRKQLPAPDVPVEAEIKDMAELAGLWQSLPARPA